MWSVVEKTALAEAEVEYQDYQSRYDLGEVSGQVARDLRTHCVRSCQSAMTLQWRESVVIWTTTPWTIPGNRAISFSSKIEYGLYEVTRCAGRQLGKGRRLLSLLADKLAADVMKAAKVESRRVLGDGLTDDANRWSVCAHPLASLGYDFDVPLLDGDHVTDDTGTGFVHTAPGHGADDYNIWTANQKRCVIAASRPRSPSPSTPTA